MILIESIEKVWCEMREFVKSMECNQKLINQLGYSCSGRGSSLFDKWTSISESCRVAAEFSEKVQSLTNTYVKEIRKIQ